MKLLSKITLIIAIFFAASPLTAQMADYYVNVKTWDVWIAWPDGGGTDNHIEMVIYGDRGNTGRFYVQGSSEAGKLEGFTIRKADVGNVNKIMIDVDGQLADKWAVEYITITKGKNSEDRNSEDGFYEFSLNAKLGYDPTYFSPTHVKKPRLQLTASGATKLNKTYYTKVNFGHNPHPTADQEVMQYSETWQFVETVSISNTEEQSTDASITLGYESPETVYGKFSAEATAAWGSMTSQTREDSEEKLQSSTYNWNYVAPANTAVFKKIVFEIPYGYVVYSDGQHSRVVRKLQSQVIPSGLDQFLFIPTIVNGQVEPVKWDIIEEEWLKHVDPQVKTDIVRQFKNKWLAEGWVYVNNKPSP
ncbi:MAG: PLAT/LH2 domain-containing protein, partial [Bacteroidia bacterium]